MRKIDLKKKKDLKKILKMKITKDNIILYMILIIDMFKMICMDIMLLVILNIQIKINECKENIEEVLKNSLLDYSLNYLSFQDYEGRKLYQSNKKNNKKNPNNFNLSFIVFDNRDGINDITLQYNIIFKKQKCSDFYLEEGKKMKHH
jgi:hypothetical protein